MSWRLLDGPSRHQQGTSWVVPEHLRENPQRGPGPFRRPLLPDPDALLQYIDTAISITENAQATRQLTLLYGSSSTPSTSSSSAVGSPIKQCADDSSMLPPLPSARKISRFKSAPPLPQKYINSLLKHQIHEEATPASQRSNVNERLSAEIVGLLPSLPQRFEKQESLDGEKDVGKLDEGLVYDARAADDAYRTACCALSEGNAELALSLLRVAAAKCPSDKSNALGKVQRLMGAALQLVEKNSAVLRSLPADKDD